MNIRKPYYREFRRRFYETLGDKGDSILRYRGADNKEHYIASGNSPDVKPGGGMVETTWAELKALRDAGKLIPGTLYRITDYQCTTTQENTQSAGHQFDIVLLALSKKKLAEEGWAMMHENIYDVKFSDGRKKCYIAKDTYYSEEDEGEVRNIVDLETGLGVRAYVEYLEIDEENKEAHYPFNIVCLSVEDLPYNYFQNSNLSAWKVWYCLDNDTTRFAWAQKSKIMYKATPFDDAFEVYVSNNTRIYDSKTYYACLEKTDNQDVNLYVLNKDVNVNTEFYTFGGPSGREKPFVAIGVTIEPEGTGVIYRLIDEFNNDVPYDFKNIQFVRKLTDGEYDPDSGEDTWVHTFTWLGEDGVALDASVVAQNITNGQGGCTGCHDNVLGACSAYGMGIKGNTFVFALNDIVFISAYSYGNGIYYGCHGNKFGADCHSNTFGDTCNRNTFGNYFFDNTFGNSCSHNTFGNKCQSNTFGNTCNRNTFGNNCGGNTFGNECSSNTFGNTCSSNTFGNKCQSNTFGDTCNRNTFGNECNGSTFSNLCETNIFGNSCTYNTFGNSFFANTFGNGCGGNTFGDTCNRNTFGNNCGGNTFGNNAEKCSVGDGVQNITVSKDFIRYVIIENGNQKITITSNKTTSSSAYLQNFLIALGVNNSNNTKTISHDSVGDAFRTVYQNENSTSVDV